MAYIIALTDNEELNALICQYWDPVVGGKNTYRWTPGTSDMLKNLTCAGNSIWHNLQKPTLLEMELKQGRAKVITSQFNKIYDDENTIPLVAVSHGKVIFPSIDHKEIRSACSVLALQRRNILLGDIIRRELIYDSKAKISEEFFQEALQRYNLISFTL